MKCCFRDLKFNCLCYIIGAMCILNLQALLLTWTMEPDLELEIFSINICKYFLKYSLIHNLMESDWVPKVNNNELIHPEVMLSIKYIFEKYLFTCFHKAPKRSLVDGWHLKRLCYILEESEQPSKKQLYSILQYLK